MNIFMIYPSQGNMTSFNYGVGSIIAVLKEAGHHVKLLIVDDYTKARDIVKEVMDFNSNIVGFSCMSNYWQYVKDLSARIKSAPRSRDIRIFVGGAHAIVRPLSITESGAIDGFCVSEGEYAFLDVAEKIARGADFRDTANFYFRDKKGGVIKNEISMLIENLDALPFPDREAYPRKVFANYTNFTFSRGCPYSCSYCCNSAFHRIFKDKGRAIRYRSVAKAIEEIRVFTKRYKSSMLNFDDDCFNKKPQWFKEFCHEYKQKIGIPYTCNTRPELLNRESARMLKESGCRKINIGIESGDETLRRGVLNRHMRDEQIIAAFNYAKEAGLETMSFNMIGFPGETRESIQKTISLNKLIKPTYAQVSVFYPYAGTPLGELCEEKGLIEDARRVFNFFGGGASILKLPNLSKKDIRDSFLKFDLEIYGGGNFKRAYAAKKIKYAVFSIYNRLPRVLKNSLRAIKAKIERRII